tara:strand:- start:18019 stop:18411 length:393 start_codon:yes stop_codon:yes gene_type:complete
MVGCFLTVSADQAVLELEQSEDLIVWDPVPVTAAMLSEDGKINMGESAQTGFFRMRIETVPLPLAGFVLVEGGTLPSSSGLGAVSVDTFYIGTYETTWGEWQTVRTWRHSMATISAVAARAALTIIRCIR